MLFVILPAFNEEAGLKNLIDDIELSCKKVPTQLILVNDASTDQTLLVAKDYAKKYPNIHILSHEQNKGLGGALMTGFEYAFKLRADFMETRSRVRNIREEQAEDVILTMDADNTHPADRIPIMLEEIYNGADLVVASRYAQGGEQHGLNLLRRTLSWGAGRVMSVFFPVSGLKDYSCGYRAYRASTLERAYQSYGDQLIENRSFAAMVELLVKVVGFCKEVKEIPFSLHYERKKGKSKMKIWSTIFGYVSLIYRLKRETWGSMEWAGE
jgi:dolichol-phosphate mannosyltransferase